MSEHEEDRIREVERVTHEAAEEFFGDDTPAEVKAQITGTVLAVVDAAFAIRDGKPWRGLTDPREIAGQLLRDSGLGE